MFADRAEAGRLLAARLIGLKLENPIVFALPRGGVPIGAELARWLAAPLDVTFARKIGAPDQPELAVGAVAGVGDPGNACDPQGTGRCFGAVGYPYRIATREVTNTQYAAFLSAKAASVGTRSPTRPATFFPLTAFATAAKASPQVAGFSLPRLRT